MIIFFRRAVLVLLTGFILPFMVFDSSSRIHAQSVSAVGQSTLEEIVVTARRREENLQETPVAITVFSADDMESRSMGNLSEIDTATPNLVFDQGTGSTGNSSSAQIYMRGIGQADFLFTTEMGVGLYLDGVYMPRAIGSMMSLIDIERVEVLKGPQGTLFGKNSVGGAINITSKRPTNETTGNAKVTVGRFDRIATSGSLSGALVEDKLLGKISISYEDKDGYEDRPNDGSTYGGINAFGLRGQLNWMISEDLEILMSADYNRRRDDTVPSTLVEVDTFGGANLLALWNGLVAPFLGPGSTYDARFIPTDPYVSFATGENRSDLDAWGLSATISWDVGNINIKSITAYRDNEAYFANDGDQSPLIYLEQFVVDEQDQLSQEFQFSGSLFGDRMDWLVGAMYFHETGFNIYDLNFGPGLYTSLEALPPGIIPGLGGAGNPVHVGLDFVAALFTNVTNDSYSVFAHATYDLTSQLGLSAGVRYTYDEKDFSSRFDRRTAGLTTHDVQISDNWDAFTPKASLEYTWNDDVMTYFSVARGFKSGGFNGRPTTAFVASRPFNPEFVWTYEVGLKSDWLDKRVRFNAAYFFSDYTDLQILSVASDPQGGIVAVVENAGKAEIQGFEMELAALPTDALRLNATLGYLDAKYKQLENTVTQIAVTDELVKAPEWSFSVGAEYSFVLSTLGELVLRGDYSYRDDVQNVADNNPVIAQDGVGLVNVRATFKPFQGKWTLAVFATNLADELYISNGLSSLDSFGTTELTYARPREWGASLEYEF